MRYKADASQPTEKTMSTEILEKTGFKMSRALKELVEKEIFNPPDQEEDPLDIEPPLTTSDGNGIIRFLCTPKMSKEITGNSIGGDDRIVWDRRFLDQIKEARAKFYDLLDRGFKAFKVKKDGSKSKRRLLKFDPSAEEIIMVPAIVGG